MTNTAAATRTNHRDAGAPATAYWFGRNPKGPAGAGKLVTIERHGRGLTVLDTAGDLVDSFGDTAKFWIAPADAPAPAGDTAEQAEIDAAHIEADHENFIARQISDYQGSATTAAAARLTRPFAEVLHRGALLAVLDHAADAARAAGRRMLAEALDTRTAAAAADLAAAKRVYADDCATRTTVALPAGIETAAPAEAAPAAEAAAPVVIVPCGARKAPGLVPAGRKYTGPYAASCRAAGEAIAARTGARVLILSALHGLLELGDLVDDYDLTMGAPGSVTAERVAEQAARLGITAAAVTVLAGRAYADVVTAVWPDAARPLDGCGSFGAQRALMGRIARGEQAAPAAIRRRPAPSRRPQPARPEPRRTAPSRPPTRPARPARPVRFAAAAVLAAVLGVATLAGVWTAPPAHAVTWQADKTYRIMALGDSITKGVGDPAQRGYRMPLAQHLRAAGVRTSWVGSQRHGTPLSATVRDPDHEGHGGYTIAELQDGAAGWVRAARPDVVLLMAGTNDMIQNEAPASAHLRLARLIDTIRAARPGVTVFVSTIIGVHSSEEHIERRGDAYNRRVAALPIIGPANRVYLVDNAGIAAIHNYDFMLWDRHHPNPYGYQRIAHTFYRAMDAAFTGRWPAVPSPALYRTAVACHNALNPPAGCRTYVRSYAASGTIVWRPAGR